MSSKLFKKVTHFVDYVHPSNPNLDGGSSYVDWVEIREEDVKPGDVIIRAEVAP